MPTLGKAVQDKPPPVITDTYTSQPCCTVAETPEARTVSYRNHTHLSRGSYLQHSASVWWLLTPELAYLGLTSASRRPAPLHVCSSLVGNPEFTACANSHRQAHKHMDFMQLFSLQPRKPCHVMTHLLLPFLRNS